MLLERTIAQLDLGFVPLEEADRLGELGYLQWLGSLPGNASYAKEARRALEMARPFLAVSPAVAVFCRLLMAPVAVPGRPAPLAMPRRTRRGGAEARRLLL
ncbi:MAG: hypothetical protein AAFW69_05585 [Pseudomonadota bacterium]